MKIKKISKVLKKVEKLFIHKSPIVFAFNYDYSGYILTWNNKEMFIGDKPLSFETKKEMKELFNYILNYDLENPS